MKVIILGNGISGITAARQLRKLGDFEITVISEESPYFFSRTALMYIYMGHMREEDTRPYEPFFWSKNRIDLIQTRVEKIDFKQKILIDNQNKHIAYDKLILATGSTPRPHPAAQQFGQLKGVTGMYHLQDLYKLEERTAHIQHAVVVGGGLIGVELAEMLHARGKSVSLLVRESSYWNAVLPPEESQMVTNHIRHHGIDLQCETELADIQVRDNSIAAVVTNKQQTIPCQYVGISIGVVPNVAFLRNGALEINRGIVVNKHLQTNIPDVYAVGDCAELSSPQPGRRPIEAVWYTGKMMGETVAYHIAGQPNPYNPGIWFNSAKFFDIEYQVYGDVRAQLTEQQATIYWQHPTLNKAIRLVFDRDTHLIVGFNLMGIRFRHEVCEKWIADRTPLEEVLKNLALANFDPEFYTTYESDLVAQYNKAFGKNISLQQKRGLPRVLAFLKR